MMAHMPGWRAIVAGGWPFVFCLYGTNLYFTIAGNLNDPIVHPLVPLTKDGVWLVFVTWIIIKDWRTALSSRLALLLIAAPAAVFVLASVLHHGIAWSYFRTCKNLILYLGGGLLFFSWLSREGLWKDFLAGSRAALLTSLVLSVLLFYSMEPSNDARMYGTYGNPTSLGLAALLAIALAPNPATFCLAFYCILCSGSLSIIAASLLFMPFQAAFARQLAVRNAFEYYGCLVAVVAFILLLDLEASGIERVAIFLGKWLHLGIFDSDSLSIRARSFDMLTSPAWQALVGRWPYEYFRADGTLVAFLFNLGLVPTVILLSPLLLAGRHVSKYPPAVSALLVLLLVFSIPLQHQYELYPTTFFFCLLIAYELRPRVIGSDGSGPNGDA
jgi:hypothetical protein